MAANVHSIHTTHLSQLCFLSALREPIVICFPSSDINVHIGLIYTWWGQGCCAQGVLIGLTGGNKQGCRSSAALVFSRRGFWLHHYPSKLPLLDWSPSHQNLHIDIQVHLLSTTRSVNKIPMPPVRLVTDNAPSFASVRWTTNAVVTVSNAV